MDPLIKLFFRSFPWHHSCSQVISAPKPEDAGLFCYSILDAQMHNLIQVEVIRMIFIQSWGILSAITYGSKLDRVF